MKKLFTTLTFILSVGFWTFTSAQNENVIQKIKTDENNMRTAVEKNDTKTLGTFFHPNMLLHSIGGGYFRGSGILAMFQKGENPYVVFKIKTDTVVVLDKNLIIISGQESFKHKSGTYADKEYSREFFHTWTKHKKRWKLATRIIAM